MSSQSAHESLTIHNNFLMMALCLMFGGFPCPHLWTSECSKHAIHNPFWDHNSFLSIDTPFVETKSLAISIPINSIGKANIYVNDTIVIALDTDNNVKHVSAAIPLAIYSIARPLDPLDKIPEKEIISLKNSKLKVDLLKSKQS